VFYFKSPGKRNLSEINYSKIVEYGKLNLALKIPEEGKSGISNSPSIRSSQFVAQESIPAFKSCVPPAPSVIVKFIFISAFFDNS